MPIIIPEYVSRSLASELYQIKQQAYEATAMTIWSESLFYNSVKNGRLLVAYDQQPTGFLLFQENDDCCEILILSVSLSFQQQGIGYNLLKYLISLAEKPIILEVASNNAAAIKLYTKCGFRQVGKRPDYYKNGVCALVLQYTKF